MKLFMWDHDAELEFIKDTSGQVSEYFPLLRGIIRSCVYLVVIGEFWRQSFRPDRLCKAENNFQRNEKRITYLDLKSTLPFFLV